MLLRPTLLSLALLVASLGVPSVHSAESASTTDTATYTTRLADAQRFAGEKSWALARDAYAAALKFAHDGRPGAAVCPPLGQDCQA
jgi:hypothetical protein